MKTGSTTLLAGRYRLISLLGSGGFARVHLAADLDDRLVAIKILDAEQARNPDAVRRFEREAAITGGIRHRNVVQLIESGTHQGVPFLVLRWVPGRSLSAFLAEHGPLPVTAALPLMRQILAGLDEVHRQRVLLLDLKPGNVVVERRTGVPRIVDFGAASILGESYLIDGDHVAGTPPYMAPEQCAGAPVGPQADIYAAGVILHEMVTGLRPESARQVAASLLPPPLAAVIRRAMATDPLDRYASVWELSRALDEAAAQPVATVTATASLPRARPAPPRRRPPAPVGAALADFERALASVEQLTERFERFTWAVAGGRGLLIVALVVLLLAGLAEHALAR